MTKRLQKFEKVRIWYFELSLSFDFYHSIAAECGAQTVALFAGASHDDQYSIYQIGRKSSHGVSDVCERGDTSTLESDFKEGADRILNIIKTRGIMGGKHMSETRWGQFQFRARRRDTVFFGDSV